MSDEWITEAELELRAEDTPEQVGEAVGPITNPNDITIVLNRRRLVLDMAIHVHVETWKTETPTAEEVVAAAEVFDRWLLHGYTPPRDSEDSP